MSSLPTAEAVLMMWNIWRQEEDIASAPLAALRRVLARGGTKLSLRDLSFAMGPLGSLAGISYERFTDGVVPLLGRSNLRVERAFAYFAPLEAHIPVGDLRAILAHFVAESAQLDAMIEELDEDGDRMVSLDDFRRFYPHHEAPHPDAFRSSHIHAPHIGAHVPELQNRPVDLSSSDQVDSSHSSPEPQWRYSTTSPLQMQIGFFRLLQGAAYRSFRASYAANAETHLRVRDLPYKVNDFSEFVDAATSFYLSLGLVQGAAAEAEFRKLAQLVTDEVAALQTRIQSWDRISKTAEMREAEARIEAERAATDSHRSRFAECIEFVLALRLHGMAPTDINAHSLSLFDANRLSHRELMAEHLTDQSSGTDGVSATEINYLDVWNPVNVSDGVRPEGAIMPARFWYEQFMPQLLRCASIMNDADLAGQSEPDEATLDAWHAAHVEAGAFQPFAQDVEVGFPNCPARIKLAIRQAWRLTEHYLNGLEKRREREEFGRGSGYLSQYVAFIDVWLGRRDVEQSEMRLSFPYYIGPAVWCFLHSSAEIVENLELPEKAEAIARFKRFFRAFATMYPCPYCRHHLNRYVLRNSEVDHYPIEFLFLGQKPDNPPLQISPEERLEEIRAEKQGALRLFVWKLHNAVSSSIQRTEEWYHQEKTPLYTTRFWPGLQAELSRARALGQAVVPVDKVEGILESLKPSTRLAALRERMQVALRNADQEEIARIIELARPEIGELEDAIQRSGYLSRTYGYDPDKMDASPHFTAEEEAFARSGRFVER
jgi:hypothetical protein